MSRASKQVGTNVTKKLMTEMQALIAFACYDSPTIAQGGDSMTENTMAETMAVLYFGGDDPEIISYLDQFINGLHRFTGLFTSSDEPDEFGQIVLTMPQKLHRHGGLNIFVGPGSITKELLSKKNFTNKKEKIAGRTLLRKAKDVVATCKKMMGLVTASGSPYRDGTFPSGTNWDDYIKWCLVAMHNDYDRELKTKAFNTATTESATTTTTTTTTESAATMSMTTTESVTATTQVDNEGDRGGVVEQQALPASGSFFKVGVGFIAWALWGHIPLYDGEQMLSHLFSDVKANSSFGRGTSTRSAMRKALISASAAPVDNRRGKKRNLDAMQEPSVADNDAKEDIALLTRTLEHLAAESMEKEEKQQHHMCARLVRDKLAARRRRSEILLQQLTLASKFKKRPDATLFDEMQSNEVEIKKLEDELATLQERECRRHREMIETRRTMSCVATMIGMNPIGIMNRPIETSGTFESSGNDSGGTDATSTSTLEKRNKNDTTPAFDDVVQTSDVDNVCMECKLIPTNHVCLKCKVVRVCACCCDEHRGLSNNTWCRTCFENETPASQQIIRDGDYNYN